MKKSLRTFLAFMLLITALQLNAELVIKGVVIDNQGNPIEYANFGIVEEYFFDVTDESGYFTFAFPASIGMNHTMSFRHMSFIP